jgi:predicted methyltransferase
VCALFVLLTGCRRRQTGPNDAYRDPRVSAEDWNKLFEGEGRELFVKRDTVIRLADARPGMVVADIGAGTGLFSMMLSDQVGQSGRIYAEEIMGKFSAYIAERAWHEKRNNVVSVMGTERSIGLPAASIDLAVLTDVYHHFDYHEEMLASIRTALRDEGELFLVDFRREPGRSPAWIFEHVRAGEDVVVHEIEAAGFVSISRDDSLQDNYVRRFRRVSRTAQGIVR